jgi:hypothetical protein
MLAFLVYVFESLKSFLTCTLSKRVSISLVETDYWGQGVVIAES